MNDAKSADFNAQVDTLLKMMSLEEKIGQLYQAPYQSDFITGHVSDASQTLDMVRSGRVGSVLSVYDEAQLRSLQKTAVEETSLGIPLLFCFDVIHGFRTAFPTNLAMASSWNPALVEDVARAVAFEASHKGIHLTFSPMVDLVRDPRWGRVMESNGEDPYLSSVLTRAYVRGYQQDRLSNANAVASCVKHFIGYGAAEGGRDYNTVDLSKWSLFNDYLPPFQAAINADVSMVMTSFNVLFRRPVSANRYLLKGVLREQLGFSGVVISDYTASEEIIDHKVANDLHDVAKQCFDAGLDHEMVSISYISHLREHVEAGTISETDIDRAVARVLKLKLALGLFDNPYRNLYEDSEQYMLLASTRETAKEAALQSVVMLENNGILPLKQFEHVALLGPMATSDDLIGAWGALTKREEVVTMETAFKTMKPNLIVEGSYDVDAVINDDIDTVIVAVGESSMQSGEGHSRAMIRLDDEVLVAMQTLKRANKRVVLVVFAGRPLILTDVKNYADAVLYAWQLGTEAGHALLELIRGDVSPSGRLTMSFPYHEGQIPVYYNHLKTGRPQRDDDPDYRYRSHYLDLPNAPLYPFGYGLTYGDCVYQNLRLDKTRLRKGEKLNVSITIHNRGKMPIDEVVQLYIEAKSYSISRPVNELKGFKKVRFDAGESKELVFSLDIDAFRAYNALLRYSAEDADYYVKVGPDSATLHTKNIRVEDH